ncbi:16S rRNA (cytosine(1402)-N(4))-methyltransferase RsmH [Candidatus Saccharibacteria bacterium]|nr:16S rRNA (cytosine(1402)-N(4))-methyltransferase RsmH [Candidatus Saccharibacteria bacterium]
MTSIDHTPVLLKSTIDVMAPKPGERYLDLTAGYGGHAKEFLRQTQNHKDAVLVDRDDFAIEHLKREFRDVKIINQDFYGAVSSLVSDEKRFDVILMDLGVSSPQLDNAERGFSFRFDSALDMRMDRGQKLSAHTIVNNWRESGLIDIFVEYGELREGQARMFARKITENRPIETTGELAKAIFGKKVFSVSEANAEGSLVASVDSFHAKRMLPRIYQAIRIAVNDELNLLGQTLPLLLELLAPGGRIGIISFHSLEDRMVKDFFREHGSRGLESDLKVLTPRPILGSEADPENPRSRSAKLRVAEKI